MMVLSPELMLETGGPCSSLHRFLDKNMGDYCTPAPSQYTPIPYLDHSLWWMIQGRFGSHLP